MALNFHARTWVGIQQGGQVIQALERTCGDHGFAVFEVDAFCCQVDFGNNFFFDFWATFACNGSGYFRTFVDVVVNTITICIGATFTCDGAGDVGAFVFAIFNTIAISIGATTEGS